MSAASRGVGRSRPAHAAGATCRATTASRAAAAAAGVVGWDRLGIAGQETAAARAPRSLCAADRHRLPHTPSPGAPPAPHPPAMTTPAPGWTPCSPCAATARRPTRRRRAARCGATWPTWWRCEKRDSGRWVGRRQMRARADTPRPPLPPSTGISHARPQAGHVHLPRRAGGAVAGGGGDAAGVLFGEGKREREGNGVGSPAHARAPARDTNISQPSQSVKYNIPVALWLGEAYPASPPTLYVRPTADMIIRPAHTFVDASGCVSTPYLAAWSGRWVV